MKSLEERQSYQAPELVQYGKLSALTGGIVCTGLGFKEPAPEIDDVTEGFGIYGDPYCSQ